MRTKRIAKFKPIRPWINAAQLSPLLAAGAWQMAASLAHPGLWWLRWVALIPLFVAIRFLPGTPAAVCGACWGGLLYLFAEGQPSAGVHLSAWLLLIVIPACFAGLTAAVTRRRGFHPIWLGFCWAVVELLIAPAATEHGFLASTRGDGLISPIFGQLTGGYLVAAMILAAINAFFVSALVEIDRNLTATPILILPKQPGWVVDYFLSQSLPSALVARFQSRAPPALCPVS